MLVQRAKSDDLHVSQHATWGMSDNLCRNGALRRHENPVSFAVDTPATKEIEPASLRTILFTVVKNEMPFILEWIAYHKLLKFDDIVVYSNASSDGTDDLLGELASHGEIHHRVHFPGSFSAQGHAAALFQDSGILKQDDFVLWLDADEFLNIKIGQGQIEDLITLIGSAEGICIPWRVFGDSHQKWFKGRLLCDIYHLAESGKNPASRNCKTMVKVSDNIERLRIHAPLMKPEFWNSGGYFRSANSRRLDRSIPEVAIWAEGGYFTANQTDICYGSVQINHYQTRSPAAFALKYLRGDGAAKQEKHHIARERYSAEKYYLYNFNDDEDTSILRFSSRLDAELQRLRAIGNVEKIQERAQAALDEFQTRYFETEINT
jgi:hypothetical protein